MKKFLFLATALSIVGCSSNPIAYVAGTPVIGYKNNLPIYQNLDINPIDMHNSTIPGVIKHIDNHYAYINKKEINEKFHIFSQTEPSNINIQPTNKVVLTIPASKFTNEDDNFIKVQVYKIKASTTNYNYELLDILQADRGENFQINDQILLQANEFGKWEIFKKNE